MGEAVGGAAHDRRVLWGARACGRPGPGPGPGYYYGGPCPGYYNRGSSLKPTASAAAAVAGAGAPGVPWAQGVAHVQRAAGSERRRCVARVS